MTHELKTIQPYFNDVLSGNKNFEVRKNDRDYKVGDYLKLKEWDGEKFTGNYITVRIKYILDNPSYCKEGYVVIALEYNRLCETGDERRRKHKTEGKNE